MNKTQKTTLSVILSMFYFAMLAYPFGVTTGGFVVAKMVIAMVIFFAISIPAWIVNLKQFDSEEPEKSKVEVTNVESLVTV